MAEALRREARDLVELEILPGLERADRYQFGRGLLALQALVGDYFAPVQGARYAPPLGDRIAEALLQAGASGAGQSSWGPTMVGITGSTAEAEAVRTRVLSRFEPGELEVWIAGPDNAGAKVAVEE
jgi:predicted sugar kinase